MNDQSNVSYAVVEELFKMLDVEIRARWSKRRQNAGRNVQVRDAQSICAEIAARSEA